MASGERPCSALYHHLLALLPLLLLLLVFLLLLFGGSLVGSEDAGGTPFPRVDGGYRTRWSWR
jgi:hypothetical protein